ncbi:endo-1,4-beta-xylanase [Paenibacillus chondroitinus]|uniref:Beta-xylanase n=1 Tax=Paenibacillus chondroitinus TaxID=59842 RepID=A0ABU6DEG2_9BACL|nr:MULTISPECIES: endo-1,4-beta-xylanase [Paenibacillus]MCY9656433.1 endo-1,4-beta-xylanase [Paenibacillus anseongense]MEB4795257.1 endo-1,4-beta-xylanase [Paenibacillus chondroitinus]
MRNKIVALSLMVTMLMTFLVQPASATYQPELPSLYQTFENYFKFGSFNGMNSFFGGGDPQSMLQHHYNSWSPANELKPQSLFGSSQSAAAYNSALNAAYSSDEERAAAIDKANKTAILASTTSQETFLNNVRNLNKNRGPNDQVKIKGHTLLWHNQTPEAFFHEGFSTTKPWASREVMLARIDSYIKAVFEKFSPYNDVIYSWDVVNEAIDDYTGYIRNESDYQVSNWGRIFKKTDLTGEDRLLAESEYIRQAFASASKYNKALGANWTFVYNDFYDADKPYEPKRSATITMLKPIYQQMKQDGTTFVVGMQNRNAVSLDLNVFKETFNKFAAICDEIQFTESDTRSDLVANPNYDPNALPYYLPDGSKNPNWTKTNWDNTPNAHVALVRNGWTAAMANLPEIQREQADWQADQFDFLLENSKGNGGKLSVYAFDGVSDTSTFNARKGAHIFMSADSNGNTNYTAKMSYYAMIGSVARIELKKMLSNLPQDSSKDKYTPDSWNKFVAARKAANDVLGVRIYDINGVNNVKDAANALTAAVPVLKPGAVLEGPAEASKEAAFDLNYGLSGMDQNIYAQDLTFTYDPSQLEYVSAESVKPTEVVIVDKTQKRGEVRFLVATTGKNAHLDGSLLKLSWKPKFDTQAAAATISLSKAVVANEVGVEKELQSTSYTVQLNSVVVDKTVLNTLIADAQSKHDAAVVGTQVGQYPVGSKATLQAAINQAKAVANNAAATQYQVEQAVIALNAALQTFNDAVIRTQPGDTNGDGRYSVGDLAIVAAAYGKTSADPDWSSYKNADLNNDGKIDILDLASLARKILK